MKLAPTPKDTILSEGTARLYRFRRPVSAEAARTPLLVIPSLINRWYVLDLRAGASLVEALNRRFDTFCLDWGVPEDEDRYLDWDRVLKRIGRAVRRVKRETGAQKVAILGYCMGGTLSGIYTALYPDDVAALINLAGPFDFSKGGMLAQLVRPEWFDPEAIASAGNLPAPQMQSGFTTLRPTLNVSKWVNFAQVAHDEQAREAFFAMEHWANDNTPFPAAAYATYIGELYQKNALVAGQHHALGRQVDLGKIACPVLTIVASKDNICPPPAATALNERASSTDKEVLTMPGGHVGAVVGDLASTQLYPRISAWLDQRAKPLAN